jgi:arylsulfatase A-like enzyme
MTIARCALVYVLAVLAAWTPSATASGGVRKPNIIFILADDLGYGDVGCYGQKKIKTPNIDTLAAQGMRFTQAYAGSTVCAPSRCALMTGKHSGHCTIRGNARVPLESGAVTVARLLREAGYVTGLIGKWGLGEVDTTGSPNMQGFDYFFGYTDQHLAHNYYPDFLWRNSAKVALDNKVKGNVAFEKKTYSHDLFAGEALEFIRKNKNQPFFLYLAFTIPHANNEAGKNGMEVPSDAPYSKESWPQNQKNHAAMVTRMDRDIGAILHLLRELGLDDDTMIFFSSDNGPHREGGNDPTFFGSSGPFRGIKRSLHEGGIRVPAIVRWQGHVPAGKTSDHVWAFWDFLPTVAELIGAKAPTKIDGLSIVPTLLGKGTQKQHDFLYWEFHEGFAQGVRMGDWKAVKDKFGGKLELYDLKTDLGETSDVADRNPEVVARIEAYLKTARTDDPNWVPKPASKTKK